MSLPTDYDARKAIPLALVLDYFPDALCEIARMILAGQRQHGTNGWDRAKSFEDESTMLRHFLERGSVDTDGVRHSAKMVWRALAFLQKEIEAATGAPISRGSYDSSKGQTGPGTPAIPHLCGGRGCGTPECPIKIDIGAQRESWVRGEAVMGSDADEARERAAALQDPRTPPDPAEPRP